MLIFILCLLFFISLILSIILDKRNKDNVQYAEEMEKAERERRKKEKERKQLEQARFVEQKTLYKTKWVDNDIYCKVYEEIISALDEFLKNDSDDCAPVEDKRKLYLFMVYFGSNFVSTHDGYNAVMLQQRNSYSFSEYNINQAQRESFCELIKEKIEEKSYNVYASVSVTEDSAKIQINVNQPLNTHTKKELF